MTIQHHGGMMVFFDKADVRGFIILLIGQPEIRYRHHPTSL